MHLSVYRRYLNLCSVNFVLQKWNNIATTQLLCAQSGSFELIQIISNTFTTDKRFPLTPIQLQIAHSRFLHSISHTLPYWTNWIIHNSDTNLLLRRLVFGHIIIDFILIFIQNSEHVCIFSPCEYTLIQQFVFYGEAIEIMNNKFVELND